MLLLYKFLIVFVLYLLLKAIFRIKYPFWSIQPVFHYHNLYYWLAPPGIISSKMPKKHKTYFDNSIVFKEEEQLTNNEKNNMIDLLQQHYLRTNDVNYVPSKEVTFSYLQNLCYSSLIGLKYDTTLIKNIQHEKLIGIITGRPISCYLDNQEMVVNYVDYLCVHKKYRKKQIAPKLIHSYYVKQRNLQPNCVFLFKRESSKTAYVPLTSYLSYGFDLTYRKKPVKKYAFRFQVEHLREIYDIFYQIKKVFRCCLFSSLSNIETLLKNNAIYLYGILNKHKLHALYIFKNGETTIDNHSTIECVCSYKTPNLKDMIFYNGFLNALYEMKHLDRKTLLLDNVGHNYILINNFMKKNTPLFCSTNSYYFYNFAYRPVLSKDVFILH